MAPNAFFRRASLSACYNCGCSNMTAAKILSVFVVIGLSAHLASFAPVLYDRQHLHTRFNDELAEEKHNLWLATVVGNCTFLALALLVAVGIFVGDINQRPKYMKIALFVQIFRIILQLLFAALIILLSWKKRNFVVDSNRHAKIIIGILFSIALAVELWLTGVLYGAYRELRRRLHCGLLSSTFALSSTQQWDDAQQLEQQEQQQQPTVTSVEFQPLEHDTFGEKPSKSKKSAVNAKKPSKSKPLPMSPTTGARDSQQAARQKSNGIKLTWKK